jgi:hypothetical protein
VWQASDVVDKLNIPVLAYGLRTDFRGELFEGSRYLLAWADNLEEIKTICHTGRKATMVVRVDERGRAVTEGPQVEIGGNDRAWMSVAAPSPKARRLRSAATTAMSRSAARNSRTSPKAAAASNCSNRSCRWASTEPAPLQGTPT